MFDHFQICPYTGLRSFSEDESLYFKGREEDIEQATSQLQKNKFLMLTGASGDGKSSLVFAGIIPNARAGFLKSRYTNWCVAGFRPDRSPFQNLSSALAAQLDIQNSHTVESELNYGFSALVDLYKNSKRYIDIHSDNWRQADEKEKAGMKREAANLIILVDQFEELFTNPENYQHGVPSRDANLVLNLLLETARIALDEDIPIYIIFTMRSDYIGQCAAFRGLPEYIGFSQFFVPRLNRQQLQQVIEEPAVLSGNRISRRLTERLIHDLTEGVDQLPILQHALKQIWIVAGNGNEEMDLVHYAMVGGMSVQELPDEQVQGFRDWFALLPPEIKACYHAPSLQNVLDTHMNKLYQQVAGYYEAKTGKAISDEDAKRTVRVAFTCLTKIDQSRAVRNRMTLQEITNILGSPDFDHHRVGALLNIFREPENTFINPFIVEGNEESGSLHPNSVLDITHESLIRNWQYLGQWAREEYDSHSVSMDFEKQLNRWVASGKSNNFLLSIGPLTYFENWYNKAKPNAWWIARYLPEERSQETKLANARMILNNSLEFIGKSARRHTVTRTIMRYGAKRIAAVLGLLAVLTLASFAIRNYFRRQNDYVLRTIHGQVLKLAANAKVDLLSKELLVAEEIKGGRATVDEVINSIPDSLQKIITANGLAAQLIFQGKNEPKNEIHQALLLTDSLLESVGIPENEPVRWSSLMNEMNLYRVALEMGYSYGSDPKIDHLRQRNGYRSSRWVFQILKRQASGFHDIKNFNLALENAINQKAFTESELKQILAMMSPLENGLQTEWLKSNFDKNKLLIRGAERQNYGFNYNGLYQELAYLYAAAGRSDKTLQCLDTLLANSSNSFQGDYASGGDNATNIAAVYFLYENQNALDSFVEGYCSRKKTTEEDFYNHLIARTLRGFEAAGNMRLYPFMSETTNLNLKFASGTQLEKYYEKYRQVVETTVQNPDEKNFFLALSFKNEGIQKDSYRGPAVSDDRGKTEYFDRAMTFYRRVSKKYLESGIPVVDNAEDQKIALRKYLFLYPDVRTPFPPAEPRSFHYYFCNDFFLDYMIGSHQLDTLYPGSVEMGYLTQWVDSYNTLNVNYPAFMVPKPRFQVLSDLERGLEKHSASRTLDLNWLYLYLGKYAQDEGKLDLMQRYYDRIDRASIFNQLRSKEIAGLIRNQSFRMIAFAVAGYIKAGRLDKAHELAIMFKDPVNRSSLYAFAATQLAKGMFDGKIVHQVIDSASVEMLRKDNSTNEQPNRRNLAFALTMEDPSGNVNKAYSLVRNLPKKFEALQEICSAFAFHGMLYEAQLNIPEFNSSTDQADFLFFILYGYAAGRKGDDAAWGNYIEWYLHRINLNIEYVDENS